eukprot:TRINITY_DN610_c0_g1_i1.p1 TRINITY_DN610_c0_g1~~TRINITY_DN610_c0_g1_i1.p1  ORF type:complete len:575 (+),score=177.78 TRINITY_DN610_c0_g1_i1:125-1726(+)
MDADGDDDWGPTMAGEALGGEGGIMAGEALGGEWTEGEWAEGDWNGWGGLGGWAEGPQSPSGDWGASEQWGDSPRVSEHAAPPVDTTGPYFHKSDDVKAAIAGIIDAKDPSNLQEMTCAICRAPAFGEKRRTVCDHLFHAECVDTALRHDYKCPSCRLDFKKIAEPSPFQEVQHCVIRTLAEAKVDCPLGCGKEMSFERLEAHLCNEGDGCCPNAPYRCANDGCSAEFTRREKDEHANSCPWTIEVCDQCNGKLPRNALQKHMDEECPWRKITCDFCKTEGVIYCMMEDHFEKQCTGSMRILAELKGLAKESREVLTNARQEMRQMREQYEAVAQEHSELRTRADELGRRTDRGLEEIRQEIRLRIEGHQAFAAYHAESEGGRDVDATPGNMPRWLVQLYAEGAQARAALQERGHTVTGVPPVMRVKSSDAPHLAGRFQLLPLMRNDFFQWAWGPMLIYRGHDRRWKVAATAAEVDKERCVLVTAGQGKGRRPGKDDDRWCVVRQGCGALQELPSPGTSVRPDWGQPWDVDED